MNLLLDGLPSSVRIAGRDVPIETDYRAGLRFEQILKDYKLSNRAKLDKALGLYFGPESLRPGEYEEAVEAILWFYRCGAAPPPRSYGDGGQGEGPAYSYEHDAGYIYAAYMQAYHIDLAVENIHWWQFRALFQSLPADTMFMKIIGYRTAKVPAKATPEQRQRIEELKRVYALPLDADQQKLTTDLTDILMNGGDPSALLGGAERSWRTTEP